MAEPLAFRLFRFVRTGFDAQGIDKRCNQNIGSSIFPIPWQISRVIAHRSHNTSGRLRGLGTLADRQLPHCLRRPLDRLLKSIETVYPPTQVLLCIVHQVRNSPKCTTWKDRNVLASSPRTICAASTEAAASVALVASTGELGAQRSTIAPIWQKGYPGYLPTSRPITPPTAAPPIVPTALPPVSTEPPTAPTPAPTAVLLSCADIPLQAVTASTNVRAIALIKVRCASFTRYLIVNSRS